MAHYSYIKNFTNWIFHFSLAPCVYKAKVIGAFIREDSVSKSNHKNKYFLTEEKI